MLVLNMILSRFLLIFGLHLFSRGGRETIVPQLLISAINDFIISYISLLAIHPSCMPLQTYFMNSCSFQASSVIVFLTAWS